MEEVKFDFAELGRRILFDGSLVLVKLTSKDEGSISLKTEMSMIDLNKIINDIKTHIHDRSTRNKLIHEVFFHVYARCVINDTRLISWTGNHNDVILDKIFQQLRIKHGMSLLMPEGVEIRQSVPYTDIGDAISLIPRTPLLGWSPGVWEDVNIIKMAKVYGDYMRINLLTDAVNRGVDTQTWLIGSETESIISEIAVGGNFKHTNLRSWNALTWGQKDKWNFSDITSKGRNMVVNRQRKLMIHDYLFLKRYSNNDVVIVAGVAKGDHWHLLTRCFHNKKFIMYDPVKPVDIAIQGSNVIYIQDFLTQEVLNDLGEKYGSFDFMSDIRNDRPETMGQLEWEQIVDHDTKMQLLWCRNRFVDNFTLKFRAARNSYIKKSVYEIPVGARFFAQCWNGRGSTEMRLMGESTTKTWKLTNNVYHQRANELIKARATWLSDNAIEKFALNSVIMKMNVLREPFVEKQEYAIGLFSVTNVINGSLIESISEMFLRFNDFTINFIPLETSFYWDNGRLGVTFLGDDVVVTQFGDTKYEDVVTSNTSVEVAGCYTYSSDDIAVLCAFCTPSDTVLDLMKSILSFEQDWYVAGSPFSKLWRYAKKGERIEPMPQSIAETQTHLVRLVPTWIRKRLGSTKMHSFRMRAEVAKVFFDNIGYQFKDTVEETRGKVIGEYFKGRGKRRKLEASGHIADLLLCTQYGCVDMVRYVNTILGNLVMTYNLDKDFVSNTRRLAKMGQIAEDGAKSSLWHTYEDYVIGIYTALVLTRTLGLPVDEREFQQTFETLLKVDRYVPDNKKKRNWRMIRLTEFSPNFGTSLDAQFYEMLNFQKRI